MADDFAAQAEPVAPAPPPAPSISPEIEALIAQRVQALTDTRISGLQSVYDKKLTEQAKAHQQELAKVRKYIPDYEDDPEPQGDPETTRRLQELERENALLRAGQQHPQGVARYREIMGFETAEEQIAYLEALAAQAAAPAPPPPPPSTADDVVVPDTDPNRPPTRDISFWNENVTMTEEMADRILGLYSR